jgi:Zn-dependent peptidase ImmA (M78 family)
LDENGVRIFADEIPQEKLFGLSAFSERYGPCILVNRRNTLERQIFTVAHEYGHLLMHRSLYINRDPSNVHRDREVEEMADTFAAQFLVPDAGLRDLFEKNVGSKEVSAEDVVFLKRHFRVSFKMMVRRLQDSGLISKEVHAVLWRRAIKSEPDETKEPAPLNIDLVDSWQKVCRSQHLARKAVLSNMVSIGKLAELTGRNILEMRARVQEWQKDVSLVPA